MNKTLFIALFAMTTLGSCGDEQPSGRDGSSSTASIPPGVFAKERPAGAQPLAEVKKTARDGDAVVVSARVGGRVEPFVEGSALMVIADPALVPCNENPDEGCGTPWDYCCETPESMRKNTATVLVPDAEGRAVAAGLRGAGGLEPLRSIVVTGTARVEGGESLVIVAKKLWVDVGG